MSHASLLTWIPWEIKPSVAGLHADAGAPQAKAPPSDLSLPGRSRPLPGSPLCLAQCLSVECLWPLFLISSLMSI